MSKILLETKKVQKDFDHRNGLIKILKDIDLKLKPGELVAIVGPSGSGKSTLINLLGLLDNPSSGSIIFTGVDTKNLNEKNKSEIRRKKISIIFQDNNLLTDFSAIENVLMPLLIRGEKYKDSYEKAKKVLKDVKLQDRIDHFPNELSGGEQQRVAIARALVAETDLILADEPTGNLDFKTSKEIFSYFLKLKRMNKAIIFATHNRELADKADYKLSIFNGTIKRTNGRLK